MSKELPEEIQADVAVIGVGFGGFAALRTLLERGLKVAAVEEYPWIGGQVSSQALCVLDEFHDPVAEEGIGYSRRYGEFREDLRAYYKKHYRLSPLGASQLFFNPGNAMNSFMVAEPDVAHQVLRDRHPALYQLRPTRAPLRMGRGIGGKAGKAAEGGHLPPYRSEGGRRSACASRPAFSSTARRLATFIRWRPSASAWARMDLSLASDTRSRNQIRAACKAAPSASPSNMFPGEITPFRVHQITKSGWPPMAPSSWRLQAPPWPSLPPCFTAGLGRTGA